MTRPLTYDEWEAIIVRQLPAGDRELHATIRALLRRMWQDAARIARRPEPMPEGF